MGTQSDLERFTQGFRDEHRGALRWLLAMAQAFRDRDKAALAELFEQGNAGFGPHMRYEEETMYPALVDLYGAEWVESMVADHDRGLGMAQRLMELAEHTPITDADIAEAERLTRAQLPHVTDCDGLVLAIEALTPQTQRAIAESRDRAIAEGLTMMEWAERRGRSVPVS